MRPSLLALTPRAIFPADVVSDGHSHSTVDMRQVPMHLLPHQPAPSSGHALSLDERRASGPRRSLGPRG